VNKVSVYELHMKGLQGASFTDNVFHYIVNQTFAPEDAAELTLTDFVQTFRDSMFRASIRHRLSEAYAVKEYYAVEIVRTDQTPATDPPTPRHIFVVYGEELRVLGGVEDKGQVTLATSDVLPSVAAVSISFRGRLRERKSRGGKRFCGIPESHTTVNRLDAIPLAQWQGAANGLAEPMPTVGGDIPAAAFWPVIFNYSLARKWIVPPELLVQDATRRIISATAKSVLSTQKSRQEADS